MNEDETGVVATKNEFSIIIKDRIIGSFPNSPGVIGLLIKLLEGMSEKNTADMTIALELTKEIQKARKEQLL